MRGTGAVFVFLVLMSSASGGAVKRRYLLCRAKASGPARLEALQGDGGVTIWSFAYAVGYKASGGRRRIRAMLRAVCYGDGDDDAAIASLAADIGLECDLKVRTRKATREMIER
ncbi:serine/threonine kinase [Aureococcus anophagefferens]|nr:serine/threonine kinase [Aureococcus anophagefferens]